MGILFDLVRDYLEDEEALKIEIRENKNKLLIDLVNEEFIGSLKKLREIAVGTRDNQ